MEKFNELESAKVFNFFNEISQIPRESKKETQISNYLKEFGEKRNLEVIQDDSLNVIIKKPASKGYENYPTIILQSHMDMVCEKSEDSNHNFDKDPIEWKIEDDSIYANKTTLGADNGIGVAYTLAVLDSNDIVHPAIEAVFTSDEETGMTGAKSIDTSLLKGKIFINIDSEEEGQFFLSCSGGNTSSIKKDLSLESVEGLEINISVENLVGGHSGMEINKERINANKLLGRTLNRLFINGINFNIISANGGSKPNVITPFAQAKVIISSSDYDKVSKEVEYLNASIKEEYSVSDKNAKIVLVKNDIVNTKAISHKDSQAIMNLLILLPYGPINYSLHFENLVQTSANLGVFSVENDKLNITLSIRSSIESQQQEVIEKCQLIASVVGAQFKSEDFYPGWAYDDNSRIKEIFLDSYQDLFDKKGELVAIHAGLECGLFKVNMKDVDFISFGPNMWEVHSAQEHVSISSIDRNFKLLKKVLENVKNY